MLAKKKRKNYAIIYILRAASPSYVDGLLNALSKNDGDMTPAEGDAIDALDAIETAFEEGEPTETQLASLSDTFDKAIKNL